MLEGLALCFVHDFWGRRTAAHIYLGGRTEVIAVIGTVVDTALDFCLRGSVAAAAGVGHGALLLSKRCTISAGGRHWLVAVYLDSAKLAKAGAVVCTFLDFT